MPPTARWMTSTATSSVDRRSRLSESAWTEPSVSPLMTTFKRARSPALTASKTSSSRVPVALRRISFSRSSCWRLETISRTREAERTTSESPACGTPSTPRTRTGIPGPALVTLRPRSSRRARTRPPCSPQTKSAPTSSVPRSTSTVATGPMPRSSCASTTVPRASRSGFAFSSSISAWEEDLLEQVVQPLARLGRDIRPQNLAAEVLEDDLACEEFPLDLVHIRRWQVDLVHRDDDGHARVPSVADRFDRLRHHGVVGRHDENHDVRDLRAARPHRRKRLVAGRVEESDRAPLGENHVIGADVLRDPAGLARDHVGAPDAVQQ